MNPDAVPTLLMIATPLLTVGAAMGGIKVGLNGTRQRVKDVEDTTKKLQESDGDTKDRLARIETKIDLILTHKDGNPL